MENTINKNISVKDLGDGKLEIHLGVEEYELFSAHAKESDMTIEDYLVSVINDYTEILAGQLEDEEE